MATHHLDGSKTHPYFERDSPPRLVVSSGDVVVIDCPEPCGQVGPDWESRQLVEGWDVSRVHACVGPIDVREAKAGQTLAIEVLNLEHTGWGWSGLIPGFGLFRDRFPEPYLHHWTLNDNSCDMGVAGLTVPYDPFLGVVAVAPLESGRLDTIPPRANGGNLDCRDVRIGSRLELPVFRDGAGLLVGDGHAAQGHGEVAGTAVEAPLRATLRLTVMNQPPPATGFRLTSPPPRPRPGVLRSHLSVGPDPRTLALEAMNGLLDDVIQHTPLTPEQAAVYLTAAGDLHIAQAVDEPHWTVSASVAVDGAWFD